MDFSDFLDATLSVGNDLVKPQAAQQSDIMRNCLHLKTFENISTVRYHVFWYFNIHNVHFQKNNLAKILTEKIARFEDKIFHVWCGDCSKNRLPPQASWHKISIFSFSQFLTK